MAKPLPTLVSSHPQSMVEILTCEILPVLEMPDG